MTLSRCRAFRVITSMDREHELQLVDRLRTGDPGAFDAVHEAFNGRLYNFLARLSNRRDVAEDLLEETWLRLVKHAAAPSSRHPPRPVAVHRRPPPARELLSFAAARGFARCRSDGSVAPWPARAVSVRGRGSQRNRAATGHGARLASRSRIAKRCCSSPSRDCDTRTLLKSAA